jgi:hypothetical protein
MPLVIVGFHGIHCNFLTTARGMNEQIVTNIDPYVRYLPAAYFEEHQITGLYLPLFNMPAFIKLLVG